jgi:hypothetical protein
VPWTSWQETKQQLSGEGTAAGSGGKMASTAPVSPTSGAAPGGDLEYSLEPAERSMIYAMPGALDDDLVSEVALSHADLS